MRPDPPWLKPFRPAILRKAFAAGLLILLAASSHAATLKEERPKMGSPFAITVVHRDPVAARALIDVAWVEIERIENVISEWRPDTEVSAINAAAGDHPVKVSSETFELLRRSLKVTELTGGAFDVSWLSVGKLWDMKAPHPVKPSQEAIHEALKDIGPANIVLDEKAGTVFLRRSGTRIGFGGIGKGYAANRALQILRKGGASAGLVDAGGDLIGYGTREDGSPWRIGIADPLDHDRIFGYVDLTGRAIVTSGDYERFVVIDGQRYSHILDPRTGYPAKELRSVTIICPDAELADALATGVSVLGLERGMALVNRLKDVHAILIDQAGEIHVSRHLKSVFEHPEG